MCANRVTFAHRSDLRLDFSRFSNDALNGDRCSGWSIFFLRVVTFCNVRRVAVAPSQRGGCDNLEENIYPDREIRSVEERCLIFDYLAFDFLEMLIPASCAYNDRLPVSDACSNVLQYGVGTGEVDHDIDIAQAVRSERAGIFVVAGRENLHLVVARSRHFVHQRSGLTAAEE